MANREDAQLELNRKLVFERELFLDLQEFDRTLVREYTRGLAESGSVMDIGQFTFNLSSILETHYKSVGEDFSHTLNRQLSEGSKLESQEEIALALLLFGKFGDTARNQAQAINRTTQKAAIRAHEFARGFQLEDGLSEFEMAAMAGGMLDTGLNGRRSGIALTETQFAAEFSKQSEIETLAAAIPSVSLLELIVKEWISQGDSLVRDAHLDADSIQVRYDLAFIVKGQRLMYPGDTSLGATRDNVINCRCSSTIISDPVDSSRQDRSAFR